MSAPVITAQPPRAHHAYFNCRVYERQPCRLPVACQPAAALGQEEKRWPGTICDLSQGGIRLTLERRFEPGTGLAVELPDEARTVLVKVVHIKRQPDGLWSLGCKFISEMSEEEVRRLVPQPLAAKDPSVDPNESCSTLHSELRTVSKVRLQIQLKSATLIDCLAEHMVVPNAWPLAPGKTVTICGGKANEGRWKLRLGIVHCAKEPDGWVLRGQLLQSPSPAALLEAVARAR